MRPRHALIPVVLVCVLATAACGGRQTYSPEKTRACLKKEDARVTSPPATDIVASAAEGGALTVHFADNLVTVSFGLDREGARSIVRGYERFHGKNIGLTDVLQVKGNAVLLWAFHPQDPYMATIEGCLK